MREGVLPGVSLLSRRRLSGLPVDLAIGLGPGLIAMSALLVVPELAVCVLPSSALVKRSALFAHPLGRIVMPRAPYVRVSTPTNIVRARQATVTNPYACLTRPGRSDGGGAD